MAADAEQQRLRTVLLEAAYRFLRAGGEEPSQVRLVIQGDDAGLRVVIQSRPGEVALLRRTLGLQPMQRAIVQALEEAGPDAELTTRELARRAGYRLNSRFYTEFRALQVRGLVERTADGYRLHVPRTQTGAEGA